MLDTHSGHNNSLRLNVKARKKMAKLPVNTPNSMPSMVLKQVLCQQQSLKAKQTIKFSYLFSMTVRIKF